MPKHTVCSEARPRGSHPTKRPRSGDVPLPRQSDGPSAPPAPRGPQTPLERRGEGASYLQLPEAERPRDGQRRRPGVVAYGRGRCIPRSDTPPPSTPVWAEMAKGKDSPYQYYPRPGRTLAADLAPAQRARYGEDKCGMWEEW